MTGVTIPDSRRQTILVVDDSDMNRAILADMLGEKYDIIEAVNGIEAIAAIRDNMARISLILLDIVMPEMNGIEVLESMNKSGWISEIPVIMVSADSKAETIERAYNLGATDFIARPFDPSIVRKRVLNTLALYAKQAQLVDMVEAEMDKRESSVSIMISVLSQIVEFRNAESGRHVLNVNTLTELLLRRIAQRDDSAYDLTPETIDTIKLASSLHDIGKIAVPEDILNKPGKLTDKEFEIVKGHSAAGSDMLDSMPGIEEEPIIVVSRDIARWHHERYDGRGYPDGLKGEEIPLSAQVVAIADVYDALTSERCYKAAIPHEKAIEMIKNGECGVFNPFLLECLDDIAADIPTTLAQSTYGKSVAGKVVNRTMTPIPTNFGSATSSRTMELLDYERMKYDFYAKMSNEVQFEYTLDPPLLEIHDHSERSLGLNELIRNPMGDPKLISIVGEKFLARLSDALHATSHEDPIVQFDLLGEVNGESRWLHLDAHAMWAEEGEFMGCIGKLVDIHDSHKRMTDLEKKATCDSLTGLVNHAYAKQVIASRLKASPESLFVMMVLDMDKFKDANDKHGHLFGDEVLKHLSGLLLRSVRDNDIVARVGGDEFLICLETESDPKPLVERIFSNCIGEYEGFPISLSMGIDIAYGGERSYDEMFSRADNALYEMKRNGRGGFAYASDVEDCDGGSAISIIESDE